MKECCEHWMDKKLRWSTSINEPVNVTGINFCPKCGNSLKPKIIDWIAFSEPKAELKIERYQNFFTAELHGKIILDNSQLIDLEKFINKHTRFLDDIGD